MTRRLIEPIDFAAAAVTAQSFRAGTFGPPMSKIEAVRRACIEQNVSCDWCAPLLGFINDSPTVAEHWSRQISDEALNRAARRLETDNAISR